METVLGFSFQQQVYILLDGKEVYSLVQVHMQTAKRGNKWNFLPLNEEDNGKVLTVHIYQCYSKGRIPFNHVLRFAIRDCFELSANAVASIFESCNSFYWNNLLMFHYLKEDSLLWATL